MRKNLLVSFFLGIACITPVLGMDTPCSFTSSLDNVLPSDIRISLCRYLIQAPSAHEAIKNLAALLSVNKKFQLLLKENKHITRALIDYMLWNHDDFCPILLDRLRPLVCEEELYTYKGNLLKGASLPILFKKCKDENLWEEAFATLQSFKGDLLSYQIVNYCWEEATNDTLNPTIKKSILSLAVELDTPLQIIDLLITLKADVNILRTGPSPFFIVFKKFLECKDSSKEGLRNKINSLLKSGACVNHYFFTWEEKEIEVHLKKIQFQAPQSPLLEAVKHNDLEMVNFLIAQGAYTLACEAFFQGLIQFTRKKGSIPLIKALLNIDANFNIPCIGTGLPPLHSFISLLKTDHTVEEWKEIAELLCEKTDLNLRIRGATALNLAQGHNNTAFVDLLISKGAENDQESASLLQNPLVHALLSLAKTKSEETKEQIHEEIRKLAPHEIEIKNWIFPMQIAISTMQIKAVELLLELGIPADLSFSEEVPDYGTCSSFLHLIVMTINLTKNGLHYSYIFEKMQPLISLLIQKGAPKERVNSEGKTVIEKALELGMSDLATYIDSCHSLKKECTLI
ncbi:hypothetical protein H0X06_07150 [Candidatus Dependentiae bacterium]|nr:hypothetical protein [Candidatus Dependentiae bacterium]